MSTACVAPATAAAPTGRLSKTHTVRWLALAALLLVEVLAFSTRFDTKSLEGSSSTWAWLLGQTSLVGRFAISVAVAMLVFRGPRRPASEASAVLSKAAPSPWIPLAVHGGCLAALYVLTRELLEGGLGTTGSPFWFAGWAVTAACSVAALAAAAVSPAGWLRLAGRYRGTLLFAGGLAGAAIVAGLTADFFWPLLCGPTMRCVAAVLGLFYADLEVDYLALTLGTPSFVVEISPECSGFEGVGLIGVFVGTYLWSFRDRLQFPAALALLPAGMLAIWFANVLRIAGLIAIGASYSPQVALGGFHSQAGWLAFNAVALGLVFLAGRVPAFHTASVESHGAEGRFEYAAGPYLLPFLTMVGVMMLTTTFSALGFDWLYPIKVGATLAVITFFASSYRQRGELAWSWSWTPPLIGVAVFALWRGLEPWAGVAAGASAEQRLALDSVPQLSAGVWLAFRALGSIVVVPLAEELAFRGYLTRQLIDEDFESVPVGKLTWFALIASSVVFGLLHGRWLAGTLAGGLFAAAAWRRGRMMDAVVAHATANALVTCYVLLSGDLAAWS